MSNNGGKSRTAELKPGIVRAHRTLVEPKVSAQIVYRRGTSMMWLSPKEAREFGNKLLDAAEMCLNSVRSE